ncbi:MAG: flagellar export protein FliJ [Proteobacteria bacterium]|nr:flagellar export protein FliJ [Pseudomonadota bacterium]
MRGFRFRLEPVLRLRRRELDEARVALARWEAQYTWAAKALREAEGRAGGALVLVGQQARAGVRAGALHAAALGTARLALEVKRLRAQEHRLELQCGQARDAVKSAHARVRGLERLRERRRQEFRDRERRREQQVLDEVGGRRAWARRRA